MPIRLFNTQSGRTELFEAGAAPVKLYVCGVTPYDTTHLGHAFTYITFDILIRLIEHHGNEVRYVRNVTDVDDPLFERARMTGEHWRDLGRRQVAQFEADMRALDARTPAVQPFVSDEIPGMIAMIQGLEAGGYTYPIDDRLYFRTRKTPGYGALGFVSPDFKMERARETGNDPDLAGKEDPLDFLLWQPSATDEPAWESPWGPGRPGWHIECSAMSLRHLGEQIDIHGGGQDLIFPHHASEIAQSESFTGSRPFSRFWLHVGLVRLDGVKMSKSLGNLVFTRDLLSRVHPDAVRLYLLSHHYRTGWDFDEGRLHSAETLAEALATAANGASSTSQADAIAAAAIAAIDDDLDTPAAIERLRALAEIGTPAAGAIRQVAGVLGLQLTN